MIQIEENIIFDKINLDYFILSFNQIILDIN